MAGEKPEGGRVDGDSLRVVLGFACNQAFLFSLFYLGENRALGADPFAFERADLFGVLLCMVLSFMLLLNVSTRARTALLSPPLLVCYAILIVVGSSVSDLMETSLGSIAFESATVGLSSGFLLIAWGNAFDGRSVGNSIRAVFVGSALAALLCLAVSALQVDAFKLVLNLLPLVSAAMLYQLAEPGRKRTGGATSARSDRRIRIVDLLATKEQREQAVRISRKIIAGTALFGTAAGLMEAFASEPGLDAMPAYPATFILLVIFGMAAIQLINTGGFDEEGEQPPAAQEMRLDSVYRLAIFVMMAGFLLVPVLSSFGVTGESIVLAGYLGLFCVLVCLFLVMSKIHAQDPALSFARGFSALYAGEMVGILVGNGVEFLGLSESMSYTVMACAGITALFAYLFLFTEQDFRALSVIVSEVDTIDEACNKIVQDFGLSKREAEILPLVLKGRSGERIAAELYISKSTVDTHLRRIYGKTGTHGRQELIDLGERTMKELGRRM